MEQKKDFQNLIRQINEYNNFATMLGIEIVHMEEGYAVVELEVESRHLNPYDTLHGGLLYTVADLAGGAAAIAYGTPVCTANSDFHYLSAGVGTKLVRGIGKELKAGKTLMVYEVSVEDQDGKVLCHGTFTYARISQDKSKIDFKS